MTQRGRAIIPRMLTKEQAAAYCGLSAATFAGLCPIAAVLLGPDARLARRDVRALDVWLDSMSPAEARSEKRPTMAELMRRGAAR